MIEKKQKSRISSKINSYPADWTLKRIGEMTKTIAGGTPSTKDSSYWGGKIPWMNSGELNLKRIFMVEGRITEEGLNNSSTKLIPPHCVLVGLAGQGKTRGTVAMNMIELCANQSVAAIYPNSQFDEDYLYHNLDYRYDELRQLSTGEGGRGGLNLKIINSISVPLPPLYEQKVIASCLNCWDNAIVKLENLICQLEIQKKCLMQALLYGRKRLKGFNEEWRDVSMGEIFCRITRKNTEGNLNVVTISAQKGFVRQTDFFKKKVASESLVDYYLIEKGELCYNKSYSNGYDWGATKRLNDFNKAVVTTLYICFKLKNDDHSGDFFEHYFECNLLNKGLTKIAHEGGRAHGLLNVTPNDFFSLKIKIPSKNEQMAIANVLSLADMELSLQHSRLEKIREQKRGLMQVLLTGRKRFLTK